MCARGIARAEQSSHRILVVRNRMVERDSNHLQKAEDLVILISMGTTQSHKNYW